MTAKGAPSRLPPLLAAAASLAVSVALLPRTPGIGDSAEFTLALALAGIPHPTGYPLYTLLGHGFVTALHAIGASWVTAANLWSAAGAAIAAAGFTRLLQHVVAAFEDAAPHREEAGTAAAQAAPTNGGARSSGASLARGIVLATPAALFIVHPASLASATTAEVYGWNHAWLGCAAAFAMGRLRRLDSEGSRGLGTAGALAWGLLSGVALAHHLLLLLFVAPLTLALIAAHRRAGGSTAALAPGAAGLVVPVAGFAWLWWRAAHPAAVQWPLAPDAADVWRHVTGAAYRGYAGRFAPRGPEWTLIRDTMLPWVLPGLLVGALGTLRFPRFGARAGMLALLAGAALLVTVVTLYGVPDPAMYFVPPLMIAFAVVAPVMRIVTRRASTLVAAALAVAIVLMVAIPAISGSLASRARLERVDARIRAAWARVPFERGIVLWSDDHVSRLQIFHTLEGSRPGVDVENPELLTWPRRRAAFARRWGVDPLLGQPPRTPQDVARIPENLKQHAGVPVIEFPELLQSESPR